MIDFFSSIDRWLFVSINSGLATRWGDYLWPLVTDYDKLLPVRIVLIGVWLWLVVKGGTKGRTAAFLLIPVLCVADQFSSSVLKPLIARARPCHIEDGVRMIRDIHLLVDCGPGFSFPSSHAVNNTAVATLMTYYYRHLGPYVYGWAAVICISRIAVGVHYPSDVAGGAIVGFASAAACIGCWRWVQRKWLPSWGPSEIPSSQPRTSHEGRHGS